jgi:hypothetical protein
LERLKKSLPGGAGQRDLSKIAIKKGHGLKTVVSDFLPEVRAQSVRFTLHKAQYNNFESSFVNRMTTGTLKPQKNNLNPFVPTNISS